MVNPPANIDVLLLVVANLAGRKPCRSEAALEHEFAELFRRRRGRVFVAWSAQNVDRTVSLYHACLRTDRTLVIDLYTEEVLSALSRYGRLPQPGWLEPQSCLQASHARMYRHRQQGEMLSEFARSGLAAARTSRNVDVEPLFRPKR
ncbi:ribonuclease J [Bradyrhizobium shewense]|uniref:Ribonuclease J n=1 Tax=Bradyrhizobium shewense TaxID=1761772 RepID=A0A1C3XUI3_9BRAD|nr:ribonuclease J [Bradyrhizobium shewense]